MDFESDNIYEGEVRYVNNQVRFNNRGAPAAPAAPAPPTRVTSLGQPCDDQIQTAKQPPAKKRFSSKMFLIAVILLILILLLLIAIMIQISVTTGRIEHQNAQKLQGTNAANDKSSRFFPKINSCNDYKTLGFLDDGIYYIKPDEDHQPIEVYCDMTGGGWTLVASIHEDDIKKKCSAEDMWATQLTTSGSKEYKEETQWDSNVIFGDLYSCTSGDYKNIGYHTMNASDVMVWHVPSGTTVQDLKSKTEIGYKTDTGFLHRYGGNMNRLFLEHYPLTTETESQVSKVLKILASKASSIRDLFSDWVNYTYDSGEKVSKITNSTVYGAEGNKIYVGCGSFAVGPRTYGEEYRYCSGALWKSAKSTPFMLVGVVENRRQSYKSFNVEIQSTRQNADNESLLQDSVTQGNYKLSYRALQFVNDYDPTVCEYYFVVSNVKEWGSIEPASFEQTVDDNAETQRRNRFQATGRPVNIIIGYMLLTRGQGLTVTKTQASAIAKIIMTGLVSATKLFRENRATVVANSIAAQSNAIKLAIPDWYNYFSGVNSYHISDSNLYEGRSSQVTFNDGSYAGRVYNGHNSILTADGSSVISKKMSPLIVVSAVSNNNRKNARVTLSVQSRLYEGFNTIRLSNKITKASYTIHYYSTQFVSGTANATACEFLFAISSPQTWISSEPFEVSHSLQESSYSPNKIHVDDYPANIVIGYILLASKAGNNFTIAQTDEVANLILDAVSTDKGLFNELPGSESLVVPTTFVKGDSTSLLKTIPPNFRRYVETGYLQFRAFNSQGVPNALCAGVKVKSKFPEYVCIGGLSRDVGEKGTCGDYAGWEGTKNDKLNALAANGSAHSLNDISHTILIFYR